MGLQRRTIYTILGIYQLIAPSGVDREAVVYEPFEAFPFKMVLASPLSKEVVVKE